MRFNIFYIPESFTDEQYKSLMENDECMDIDLTGLKIKEVLKSDRKDAWNESDHYNDYYEIIPESMDFVEKLFEIYPPEKFNMAFVINSNENMLGKVCPYLSITVTEHTDGGSSVNITEDVKFTEKELEFLYNKLSEKAPDTIWMDAFDVKKYVIAETVKLVSYEATVSDGLLSDEALDKVAGIIVTKYGKEIFKDLIHAEYEDFGKYFREVISELILKDAAIN